MKAIILLLFGLILLGGAGYGGWMLYTMYIVGEDGAEEKVEEAKPPPGPPAYLRMPPVVVPVIGASRVQQFVTVVVTVEVVQGRQGEAQANVPRLQDAFLSTMYGALDDKSVLSGALVNIAAVKEKLTAAAEKVLGPGIVQGVLVQVVTQRNL